MNSEICVHLLCISLLCSLFFAPFKIFSLLLVLNNYDRHWPSFLPVSRAWGVAGLLDTFMYCNVCHYINNSYLYHIK